MKCNITSQYASKDYTAAQVGDFLNDLLAARCAGCAADCVITINKQVVSIDDAIDAANADLDARYAKKSQAHKRITIYKGASGSIAGSRHEIWVRK